MATSNKTDITLTKDQCAIRFSDGTLLKITDDGGVSITNGGASFMYAPSRLKMNDAFIEVDENLFGSQKINLSEGTSLNIRTEKSERMRVEIFFHERDDGGTLVSGCFITKEATGECDWSINFVKTDRFLLNLSELFSTQQTALTKR
jgi:hypothetical protein